MSRTLQQLQMEVGRWCDATFPRQQVEAKVRHLAKEVQELLGDPWNRSEQADVLILLLEICRLTGTSADGLVGAGFLKLEINRLRTWAAPDADGVIEHVKES